jgi:hypothetical protein
MDGADPAQWSHGGSRRHAGTAVDVIRGMASFGGGQQGDVVINMGGALADRTASIGERLVDRELSRKPTLTAKTEELTVPGATHEAMEVLK